MKPFAARRIAEKLTVAITFLLNKVRASRILRTARTSFLCNQKINFAAN